jgi:two-component system chemotaxis sensor kinase CheA
MDDLVSEFLAETSENLEALDNDLVELEQSPGNAEIVGRIFRVMHTIKGTCGFLGLARLAAIAHAAENILDKIRDGHMSVSSEAISLILKATDGIKGLVAHLEAQGAEPAGEDSALLSALNQFAESGGAAPAPSAPANKTPDLDEAIDFDPVPAPWLGTAAPVAAAPAPAAPVAVPQPVKDAAVAKGLEVAKKAEAGGGEGAGSAQSIRVNLEVLEQLMQMASELVLTRNQLLQIQRQDTQGNSPFSAPLQRLNHITTELQESVMKTRMQPIGNAWGKFPRIVRDLSMELGKKIDLQMEGAETELDRQLLDVIKDPLTHMVRNSADHGIELPDARKAAGKPETGTITLEASHEGGHIIVKISDDGKGLNVDAIKKKAVANGLATQAEVDHMTDKQVFQFIFQPGFSTAEKVTAVSGRGVGMDVVVTNIQKIGGTVELDSTLGKGSEFVIKIPLTLAIMSVLLVGCGGQRFAIPQIRVSEVVRTTQNHEGRANDNRAAGMQPEANKLEYVIEYIKDAPVLRLRESLLPLVELGKVLGQPPEAVERPYVVVCELGRQRFGVVVDRVFDTEEIVVKPVSKPLQAIDVYSGITILGDGSVIMILDPNGIARRMGDSSVQHKPKALGEVAETERKVGFLMFRAGGKTKKVVPLELVARLEEVDMKRVEWASDKPVVQYRDDLMRLVTAEDSLPLPTEGVHDVIVFMDEGKIMGLVVEQVMDIVEQTMNVKSSGSKKGILGSLVIHKETCDLIDVSHYFGQAYSEWLTEKQMAEAQAGSKQAAGKRLLLVDDSPFFRKFMKPVLSVAGYAVATAEDAVAAIELLKKDTQFDAVITDIDMPGVTGVEFVKHCKSDPALSHIPFIALTSYSKEKLGGDTKELGFSGYVSKSNRDKLVNTISQVLG